MPDMDSKPTKHTNIMQFEHLYFIILVVGFYSSGWEMKFASLKITFKITKTLDFILRWWIMFSMCLYQGDKFSFKCNYGENQKISKKK